MTRAALLQRARLSILAPTLLVLWIVGWVNPVVAGAGVNLVLSPTTQSANLGDVIDVVVEVPIAGDPFNAYRLVLDYDPAVLQFDSEYISSAVSSICPTFHPTSITPGHLDLTTGLLCSATNSITGPIALQGVRLKAIGSGTTVVTLGYAELANSGFTVAPIGLPATAAITIGSPLPVPTTTLLSSNVNPSALTQLVTFTAQVQVGGVDVTTPTGTMTFREGATVLAAAVPLVAGAATFSTDILLMGTHPITADYSGDPGFGPSTSNTVDQLVNPPPPTPTTTLLTSTPNPSFASQLVTFVAKVQVGGFDAPAATGTMALKDGATVLFPPTPIVAGAVTFTTSSLPPGTHVMTAEYSGDIGFTPSTSNVVNQVVDNPPAPQATTTQLVSSLNPSLVGQTITFTASVQIGGVTQAGAGGTMQFFDDATPIGTVSVLAGAATLSTAALGVGPHSITAVYGGDASFAASTSAVLTQLVNPLPPSPTTTHLLSSVNPSTLGQDVTFTAAVQVGGVTQIGAGGTMQFLDGASVIATMSVVSGVSTFSTTALTVGTHPITAVYSGDASFATSTSPVVSQVVNPAPPTVTTTLLASSLNPSTLGQNVTFTAAIQVGGLTQAGATGTVQFLDGASVIATMPLVAGVATFSTTALAVGSHPITAAYSGDVAFTASTSNLVTQVVDPAPPTPTTTLLVSSVNPSTLGQNVIFTASVQVGGVTQPAATGTVQFKDGASVIATMPVVAGSSSFATVALTVGSHPITAIYSGDGSFAASTSNLVTQVVDPTPPTSTATVLTSSLNPSTLGQNVVFTASVQVGGVTQTTATGTMQFRDGLTVIATMPIVSGVSSFATVALAIGSHPITAVYSGDAAFASSTSNTVDQVVNPTPPTATTTLLSSDLNPSVVGQNVTFTAAVKLGGVTQPGAGGTMQFRDGATVIATMPVVGGVAAFATTALTVGTHSITAIYSGDASFAPSTSNLLNQIVNPAGPIATTTLLVSSLNPSSFGQMITFTATVRVGGVTQTTAGGTMQFYDGAAVIGNSVVASGVATLPIATLSAGTHPITAIYSGDASLIGSLSNLVSQVVNPAGPTGTTTQLASSLNPSLQGQNVTFTATVKVGSSTATGATGTMQFRDGISVIANTTVTGGVATFSTSALAVGTHPITAVYSGDPSFAGSTSNTVNQAVNAGTPCTNIVWNSSFEGGSLTGWEDYHDATITPVYLGPGGGAPDGEWVLQIRGREKIDELFGLNDTPYWLPSTIAGRVYRFSAWVRAAGPGSAPGRAALQVREYQGSSRKQTILVPLVPFTNTFQEIFVDVVALYDGSKMDFQVVDQPLVAFEAFQVDRVTITPMSGCGPVPPVATATDLASTVNPSQDPNVTLTAAVKVAGSSANDATGVMQFMDGAVPLGEPQPLVSGAVTFTTPSLAAGRHSISAVYSGDAEHTGSASPILTQIVRAVGSGGSGGKGIISADSYGNEPLRFEASLAPNPVHANGTLAFATTQAGPLRVGLFDIAGRQIRSLANEPFMSPGRYRVRIDSSDPLPPGLYFYRIEAAEGVLRGRFVMMR